MVVRTTDHDPSPPRRTTHRFGRALLVPLVAGSLSIGCSDEGDSAAEGDSPADAESLQVTAGESVDDLVADLNGELAGVVPIDRRPDLLAQLGAPESFVLSVGAVDGVASRFESWQYWSSATQVDLVDGEIAFNIALNPVPDGTILPLAYAPDEFVLLSTVDEVQASLADLRLTEVDGVAEELELPGARTFVAEQLLLAFVDDLLVYVQTYPLLPEEA